MMLIYVLIYVGILSIYKIDNIKNEKQERQVVDKNNGYMQKIFKFNIHLFLNLRRL